MDDVMYCPPDPSTVRLYFEDCRFDAQGFGGFEVDDEGSTDHTDQVTPPE